MRYLTKEWYETCQQTGLHFGMRVHKGAALLDEALFQRLYKRKEKEHVKLERDVYDTDPRFMLEHDGQVLTRADKAFSGEEVTEDDQGYELHVLLDGEPMPELIVRCTDIIAETE